MKTELDTAMYAESIKALMSLALTGTGGAKVAAQVLLSAYNGKCFQLDVSSLCNLDNSNYQHAMNIIHGRARLYQEPQSLFKNGSERFDALWDKWEKTLHLDNRKH